MICVLLLMLFFHLSTTSTIKNQETKLMELFLLRSPPSSITHLSSKSSSSSRAKASAITSTAQIFLGISRLSRLSCSSSTFRNHHRVIRASGLAQAAVPNTKNAKTVEVPSKDKDLAFVAGATGKVGSRAVRELLKLGFRVRAGVRSAQRAKALIESVREIKLGNAAGSSEDQPVERLEIVECDLEKEGNILPALGNASVVLCCIGASEKEVLDITGPYRIDYKATENLIKAATAAKVDHFILLTSLGTNKIGFPASILNLFWGVLIWKRKAEEALIASGLPYTIVRPGGMERPTDSYKETHNIVLANEDTYFGGQVSNLQVAELMAFIAKNPNLSYCKVVEVIAQTTAPLLPMEDILAKISSQREAPGNVTTDLATPMKEESPAKLVAEEAPSTNEVQNLRPLSPYAMYDDLKPPTSPTPTPSVTPQFMDEKEIEVTQAKYDSEPPAALSPSPIEAVTLKELTKVSDKISPLSPYTAYEDLKPPSSPSPTPSSSHTGPKESTSNGGPLVKSTTAGDAAVTDNPVVSGVQETPQVTDGNSDYRSPYPVYEEFKPPTSPTPSLPKH